jgi:hypothetical protein
MSICVKKKNSKHLHTMISNFTFVIEKRKFFHS